MADGNQVPTFKLVLVGDGGTGKVSDDTGVDMLFRRYETLD